MVEILRKDFVELEQIADKYQKIYIVCLYIYMSACMYCDICNIYDIIDRLDIYVYMCLF